MELGPASTRQNCAPNTVQGQCAGFCGSQADLRSWPSLLSQRKLGAYAKAMRHRRAPLLLQLRVLRLGLLQDGDVGIGILPESEKFLVGFAGSPCIAAPRKGTPELQMG